MVERGELGKAVARYFSVVLLTGALGVMALAADFRTNTSQTCAMCHTMRPQYYTWKTSSHAAATDCFTCHLSPGLDGAWQMTQDLARMVQRQISGTYPFPVLMLTYLDDASCRDCHTPARPVSAGGAFQIPHQPHTDMRVRCTACHNAVAHGGVSAKSETRKTPAYRWDAELARQKMDEARAAPLKEDCMGCHYLRRVSNSCNVCHADGMIPGNHLAQDFLLTHGAQARADLQSCNVCHGMQGKRRINLQHYPEVERYARVNAFCRDCHAQRPAGHGEGLWQGHGRAALLDQRRCLACHDNQEGFELPPPALTTCASCHPSGHRPGWQQRHSLPPDPQVNDGCWTCHNRDFCRRCHVFWEQGN
jgi:nitrate/TMAO reductase-like tetraheme cytochrome c subunit